MPDGRTLNVEDMVVSPQKDPALRGDATAEELE
jgi:hypothetical protein